MNRVGRLVPIFLLLSCLLVFGCNPSPPAPRPVSAASDGADHAAMGDDTHDHAGHDHHEHADHDEHHESYAEAVTELDSLRMAAKDALAAGNLEAADDAVHEIGEILEELPDLAAKEAAIAADETIKPAIKDLYDCFDSIDQKLHGDVGKTYDEVAERIDAAMKTLRARATPKEK